MNNENKKTTKSANEVGYQQVLHKCLTTLNLRGDEL